MLEVTRRAVCLVRICCVSQEVGAYPLVSGKQQWSTGLGDAATSKLDSRVLQMSRSRAASTDVLVPVVP